MAKGEYKCNSCGRTFSMPAHLARHMSSMHRRPGRPKGSAGVRRGRRPGRPRVVVGRRGATVDGDVGNRVLSEMEAYRDNLLMQRAGIERRLEGLEAALSAMGSLGSSSSWNATTPRRRGRPPGSGRAKGRRGRSAGSTRGGRRGRPPGRPGSLRQMIVKVLRQRAKPHSPQEIADGVIRAGYKTSSDNLTKSVSNTLPTLSEVRKVGRGLYQA